MYANLKSKNEGFIKRLFLPKPVKIKRISGNVKIKPKREKRSAYIEFFRSFLTTSTIHGLVYLSDNKKHPVEM